MSHPRAPAARGGAAVYPFASPAVADNDESFSVSRGSRFDEAAGFDSADEEEQAVTWSDQDAETDGDADGAEAEEEDEAEDVEYEEEEGDAQPIDSSGVVLSHRTLAASHPPSAWRTDGLHQRAAPTFAHSARGFATNDLRHAVASFQPYAASAAWPSGTTGGDHSQEEDDEEDWSQDAPATADGDGSDGAPPPPPPNDADGSEEDSDDDVDLKPLPRGTEVLMRGCMCALSLLLLWTTSLSLAEYIAQAVVTTPEFSPVIQHWKDTWTVTQSEAKLQQQCLTTLFGACGRGLNDSIVHREAEWEAQQSAARNATLRVQARSAQCESDASITLKAINAWSTAGATLVYKSTCSNTEVEGLRALLQDRRANQEELGQITSEYVSSTQQVFTSTVGQLDELQSYNEQFVSNQSVVLRQGWQTLQTQFGGAVDTQALSNAVDQQVQDLRLLSIQLSDCGSRRGGANVLCPGGTVVDSYAVLAQQLQGSYSLLQSLGQSNLRMLTQYSAAVTNKLADVQRFFNLLYPVANGLASLGISILDIPGLGGLPTLPSNDAFVNALANAVVMPDIGNYFTNGMANALAKAQAKWNASSAEVRGMITRALQNVTQNVIAAFPPDPLQSYNPPPVHLQTDALEAQLRAHSEQFPLRSSASVQALLTLPPTASDAFDSLLNKSESLLPPVSSNLSDLSFDSMPSLSGWEFSASFAGFVGNFGLPEVIMALLTAMGGVVILGDYAYRATSTVRTVQQYTRAPADMLPVIDARTQESKDAAAAAASSSSSLLTRLSHLASNSALLAGVVVAFGAWVVALLVAAYIPYYASYREGCVESRNGTFLSLNSGAVLYNLAALQGSRDLPLQLSSYESKRMMACGRYEARYVAQQVDYGSTVSAALTTQQMAWQQMALIDKCLDGVASFDRARLPVNASLPPMEFIDPLAVMTSASLSKCAIGVDGSDFGGGSFSSSSGGFFSGGNNFNCSWLPSCPLSACSGPSEASIRAASYRASCASEYALHHALLYGVLMLVIFLCLQLSRFACTRSVTRLGWRALTPQGITFMATCDHRGRQLVAKEDERARKTRRRKERREKQRQVRDEESDEDDAADASDSGGTSSSDLSDAAPSKAERSRSSVSSKTTKAPSPPPKDPLRVQRALLRRSMAEYEATATSYLLLTLLAHVPYLLLLLALNDPLGWGSAIRIAEPNTQ